MRTLAVVWLMGATLMFGFNLGLAEYCENHDFINPIAYLGWPIAAVAVISGYEIPNDKDVCILKGE